MYIIYNEDGSIRAKNLNQFIMQGNSYANFIEIYLLGKEPSNYHLLAHFTLNNGFETNTFLDEECEMEFEGETIYGRKVSLTKTETALAGKLKLNIQALENETDIVLTTYTVYLSINEGVDPGELGYMSQEQAQQLLDSVDDAATEEYVDGEIETLKNYADDELDKKVDKEEGKGLSTNDFTDADKTKLNGIEAGAEVNEIESISINGTPQAKTNKNVDLPAYPTKSSLGLSNVVDTGDSDTPTENGTQKFTTGGAYRMQQAIDSLSSAGRFLSLWDATTGEALSDPPTTPIYQYQAGDYFRVSVGGDRIPVGSQYNTQGTNYTTVATPVVLGDVFYYDGTQWVLQSGSGAGSVLDVKFLGNSVVAAGIANITKQLVLDAIYPVGSIYMSVEQDEATKNTVGKYGCKLANLGGTWARLEDRFLIGASSNYTINTTGGYADAVLIEHNHSLTAGTNSNTYTSGNPSQTYYFSLRQPVKSDWTIDTDYSSGFTVSNSGSAEGTLDYSSTTRTPRKFTLKNHTHTTTINFNDFNVSVDNAGSSGETGVGKNIPPYLAVYMWKRIG